VTFEQVMTATNAVTWRLWSRDPHDLEQLSRTTQYHQHRTAISYDSRKKRYEQAAL